MKSQIHAIISGRVQLVMYRDFARRNAKSLGLFGTVENLPDGTVSVIAGGEKSAVEKYIEILKKGSVLSRVDDVSISWSEPSGTFSDFLIVY